MEQFTDQQFQAAGGSSAAIADYENISFDKFQETAGAAGGAPSDLTNFTGSNDMLKEFAAYNQNFDVGSKLGGNQQLQFSGVMSTGFKDFLLKPELQRSITDCGFEHPSEVQQECIPQAMMGTDIMCQAKSGMGKTAVFVLCTLQQLDEDAKPLSVIVLCHTRELAFQIKSEYDRFTKYLGDKFTTDVVYGGQPIKEHIKMLQKKPPTILIGTPGRMLALVKMKHMDLSNVKHFVVDECDQMLEALDMRADVQSIFIKCPGQKQVLMFSATFKKEVREDCRKFMQSPFTIQIDNEQRLTLHGLLQYYEKLQENQKNLKLIELLDALEFNQVIIFVSQVKRAEALSKLLCKEKFPTISMSSGLRQEERIKRYETFKNGAARLMVSTDIFGRGIDFGKVNLVINYDMPQQMDKLKTGMASDQYLHRVGRAGRFGTRGLAISFVATDEDQQVLEDIQKRFEVKIDLLPGTIDKSSYMNA